MGKLIRLKDWSKTSLGPMESWPQSLKTTVNILLSSKFPMFLWWGKDLIQFYNDGYRPSFGQEGKHPMALGQRGEDCWPEIWPVIKPQIDQVLTTGVPTWNENHLVPIYRNGGLEEVYWTYSYSPVCNEAGDVEGVLVVVNETTQNVVSHRQILLLRDLALASARAKTVEEAAAFFMKVNEKDPQDIPFSLLYLFENRKDTKNLKLKGKTGLEQNKEAYPDIITQDASSEATWLWPVWEVLKSGKSKEVVNLTKSVCLTGNAWPEPVESAFIVPIVINGSQEPIGVFISGVNPRNKKNKDYKSFFELIGGYIGSALNNAYSLEEERKKADALSEIERTRNKLKDKEIQLLKNSEEERNRLYDVFMQAPAVVCILRGPEHVYELINPLYQQLFGSRKLIGKPIREALPEVEGQGVYEILDRVYQSGEPFIGEEILVKLARDEGSPVEEGFFNFIYAPIKDDKGVINGIYVFAYEVTAQVHAKQRLKQYNSQLSEKNNELQKINNDLDNFVYTASHDLKAPISNIEGLINSLRDSLLSDYSVITPETDILLQMIDKSILRFKNTILDLTEISKAQRTELDDVHEINCAKVIEDVKLSLYDQIVKADAEITTGLCTSNLIRFSKKNLNSIVYNLLSNAIKYRDPNRKLQVMMGTECVPGYLVFTIKDNGLGISEKNINKIFKMFKRFHDHVEGSGIGLYIVKRIIDNAGGKIEVKSEEGKGTTFRIYFKA